MGYPFTVIECRRGSRPGSAVAICVLLVPCWCYRIVVAKVCHNWATRPNLWMRGEFSTESRHASDTNAELVWPLLEMNQNQREATRSRPAGGTTTAQSRLSGSSGLPSERSVDANCDQLWRIQDVAAFLGVPVATLYQWRVRHEGPPAMKLGKHLRFDPRRVREWAGAQSEDSAPTSAGSPHGSSH